MVVLTPFPEICYNVRIGFGTPCREYPHSGFGGHFAGDRRRKAMDDPDERYLQPTSIIDSDHEKVIAFAREVTAGTEGDPVSQAVHLYYAVRDGIRYTPYYPFYLPEHYRASRVLEAGLGYCVPKASLLCALGRACGIPTRVGFAHVRNHLSTKQLLEYMGSDLFVFHGYNEFYLEGRWVKATPAFNAELCHRHRVAPLEFNGRDDSLFQLYNLDHHKFMEYVEYVGTFDDIPVKRIVRGWEKAYGMERVKTWIDTFEKTGEFSPRRFEEEDVIQV
jgi:transglutaminase-like putative cysteine protease